MSWLMTYMSDGHMNRHRRPIVNPALVHACETLKLIPDTARCHGVVYIEPKFVVKYNKEAQLSQR